MLFVFVFTSCQEDDTTISQQLIDETTFAENVFAQLADDVEEAVPFDAVSGGRGGIGFKFGFGKCMTRTVESPEDADFPKTITIEYDSECTSGESDVVKSGKIIITLTGAPREEGSQRIVTFDGFSINGNEVTGTKTYTYNGNGQFTCTLVDGNILTRDGNVIVRESTKTRTLVSGGETDDRSDDVYEVTGEIAGVIIDGDSGEELSYTKIITSPLVRSKDCFWITQGTVETTIGDATSTVDFGDGTCDNIAVRTDENGESEEFTMQMRVRKMWRHKHNNKG